MCMRRAANSFAGRRIFIFFHPKYIIMSMLANFIFIATMSFAPGDSLIPPPPPPPLTSFPPTCTNSIPVKYERIEKNEPIVAEPEPPKKEVIEIYHVVEEMPLFPACQDVEVYIDRKKCADKALISYIQSEVKYPEEAKNKNIQGTVVISFVVDEQGNLINLLIRKKVGGGCEEEALRVVEKLAALPQKWTAGKQRGKNVKVHYNLPVRFNLQK
jgi:protein TonB